MTTKTWCNVTPFILFLPSGIASPVKSSGSKTGHPRTQEGTDFEDKKFFEKQEASGIKAAISERKNVKQVQERSRWMQADKTPRLQSCPGGGISLPVGQSNVSSIVARSCRGPTMRDGKRRIRREDRGNRPDGRVDRRDFDCDHAGERGGVQSQWLVGHVRDRGGNRTGIEDGCFSG